MKKVLTIALVAALSVTVNAQEKVYKPIEGMTSLEVTFDPSSIFNANNGGPTFALPSTGGLNNGIKYRSWASENVAYRGTFLLGFRNVSTPTVLNNSNGDDVDAKDREFEWAVQIRPGVERHFAGTNRLSPYVGSELIIGYGSNKITSETLDANDAIVEDVVRNSTGPLTNWSFLNGLTLGAGLVGGFDFYVAESLYMGLELNYAFVYNKSNKLITEINGQDKVETLTGSNWFFNPSAGANLRLGWNF